MPQMMPMNWMMISCTLMIMLVFLSTLIYYYFTYKITYNNNLINMNKSMKFILPW